MSVRLMTPTGRPARSMTGAALKPLSVKSATASLMHASARMETGFGVMRSAAVSAARTRHAGPFFFFSVAVMVALLPGLLAARPMHQDRCGRAAQHLVGNTPEQPRQPPAAVGFQGDQVDGVRRGLWLFLMVRGKSNPHARVS